MLSKKPSPAFATSQTEKCDFRFVPVFDDFASIENAGVPCAVRRLQKIGVFQQPACLPRLAIPGADVRLEKFTDRRKTYAPAAAAAEELEKPATAGPQPVLLARMLQHTNDDAASSEACAALALASAGSRATTNGPASRVPS